MSARAVWWAAFADCEAGEVICRVRVTAPGLPRYYVRDAVTLAEAVDYARTHTTEFDTARPRVFKRAPHPGNPNTPIGRAA